MGRVSRYKKVKKFDANSQRKSNSISGNDDKYDEPPELHNERVKKSLLKIKNDLNDEDVRERMYQREAIRNEKKKEALELKGKEKVMDGRKDGESMKEFKSRIRQETRDLLVKEVRGMSATAKKKKARLNERKKKRKLGSDYVSSTYTTNNGDQIYEEEGFSCRQDGYLRASDLGASDTFNHSDNINFGERVERPPELDKFISEKQKARKLAHSSSNRSSNKNSKINNNSISGSRSELHVMHRLKDFKDGIVNTAAGSGSRNEAQPLSERERELLRNQAVAAYKTNIKNKRVKGAATGGRSIL